MRIQTRILISTVLSMRWCGTSSKLRHYVYFLAQFVHGLGRNRESGGM